VRGAAELGVVTIDKATGHKYILLEKRLDALYKNPAKGENTEFTVLSRFKGQDLVGKKYVPLFDYFYEVRRPLSCTMEGSAGI